jgi:hypothetical protein
MVLSLYKTEVAADTDEWDSSDPPSWMAVVTGLNVAIAVSYLACKPPQTLTLSLKTRLLTSVFYILLACLAGTVGTWIMLSDDTRSQFRSLILCGARSWVFLPVIMMFLRESSIGAPLVAIVAAALMAAYWSRLIGLATHGSAEATQSRYGVEKHLFITQLRFERVSRYTIGATLCLYAAFFSAVNAELELWTLFLGSAVFLLVSQITTPQARVELEATRRQNQSLRAYSSYAWIAGALCLAFIALSASSGTSDRIWQLRAFHVWRQNLLPPRPVKQPSEDHSSEGYRAIVLWPIQKKEKVIPPPPTSIDPGAHRAARPWIIPFNGPYWYFKTPGESPGPEARITHGDPLKVNVRSTNRVPLLMEAHQNLAVPIDLSCCREIQVVFKNDTSLGASDVGLLLTDSHAKGKPSQNLGIQYVPLNGIDQPPRDMPPVEETVSFPLPASGKIRKFDRMTVVLLPDAQHVTAGRKVAVERFIMIPK